MSDDRYEIVVGRPAAIAITEQLPEAVAAAVIELITEPFWTIPGGMVRRLESLMESAPHVYGAFNPDGPAEATPLRMPPRIPGARDLTLSAERRLITAPFLWADGDQLLKQADHAQDDDCFEVFVIAPSVELAR